MQENTSFKIILAKGNGTHGCGKKRFIKARRGNEKFTFFRGNETFF
jgi:hypothetical protein